MGLAEAGGKTQRVGLGEFSDSSKGAGRRGRTMRGLPEREPD